MSNQPAHITLLEPVIVPPRQANGYQGFTVTVRGRLDNGIFGEFDPGLNPSTRTASALDPSVLGGLKGRVEVIPSGTEVTVTVTLAISRGYNGPDPGVLDFQVATRTLGPHKTDQFITQDIARRIPVPAPGATVIAENTMLSFATQCGCPYSMSVAEFRRRSAAYAAAPPAPMQSARPILAGSRIQTVLLEPITVAAIQSGQRFHARLNTDMELPRGMNLRSDALQLKRGTDVYLKVVDPNPSATGGHNARLEVDFVVFNGQQIPLKVAAGPLDFATYRPGARVRPLPDLRPLGSTTWWDVTEQAEVSVVSMNPGPASARKR